MDKVSTHKALPLSSKKRGLAVVILLAIGIPFFLYQLRTVQKNNIKRSDEARFSIIAATPLDQVFSYNVIGKPTIRFSKRVGVSENELDQYFSINPLVSNAKWYLEDRGQTVTYGYSKQEPVIQIINNTTYTISIKKTLKSFDGEGLQEGITTTFRTE